MPLWLSSKWVLWNSASIHFRTAPEQLLLQFPHPGTGYAWGLMQEQSIMSKISDEDIQGEGMMDEWCTGTLCPFKGMHYTIVSDVCVFKLLIYLHPCLFIPGMKFDSLEVKILLWPLPFPSTSRQWRDLIRKVGG